MLLQIANRPIDTNTTYTTGGDVSRFQRRTVPGRTPSQPAQSSDPLSNGATAIMSRGEAAAPAAAPNPAPVPSGPVVRISRGNSVTVVPVGAH